MTFLALFLAYVVACGIIAAVYRHRTGSSDPFFQLFISAVVRTPLGFHLAELKKEARKDS